MQPIKQTVFNATALAGDFPSAWCVAEYSVIDQTGALPPVSMIITATKLRDVFTFAEVSRNSEWRKCVTAEHAVLVTVTLIGDRPTCQREANRAVMARNPRPRCNMYGFNSFSLARPILCSNGETYQNQAEAARILDLNQGAISRHLKGELRSVKGYTFIYKDN
jgi:hypothetical protein